MTGKQEALECPWRAPLVIADELGALELVDETIRQRIADCPAPGFAAFCTRIRSARSVALRCFLPSLKTSMRAAMLVVVDGTCANPLEGPPSRAIALQTTGALHQHPSAAPSER